MLLDFVLKNVMAVVQLLILIGTGLWAISRFKAQFDAFKVEMQKDMNILEKELAEHSEAFKEHIDAFQGHVREAIPHPICALESGRLGDVGKKLDELTQSVKRVEGWIMAIASKSNIKGPTNGI